MTLSTHNIILWFIHIYHENYFLQIRFALYYNIIQLFFISLDSTLYTLNSTAITNQKKTRLFM